MTKRNPLLFDAALTANWAIDEAGLQTILEIASRENQIEPSMLAAYHAQQLEKSERAGIRDGVAILNVEGPLFKRANMMTMFCGATSYDVLRTDLQVAMDNMSVRSILLNIHSPGGEAAGTSELAQAIFEARGTKPIHAYAGDLAASAAYWIASAADKIWVGPAAALGSIGVRAAITDTSKRDEARGVKSYEFVSSQSPYKKVDLDTKQGRDRVQARVDAMAAVFVETVARNRGTTVAHVLEAFGKGDVLIGQAAVNAGMADGFGTFESILASLARGEEYRSFVGFSPAASGHSSEEVTMTDEQKAAAAQAEAEAKAKAEAEAKAAAEAKAKADAQAKADSDAAVAAAVTAERARISGIHTATLPGYEQDAFKAIETGSSVAEFQAMVIASEKAKGTTRAAAVESDTKANAEVAPANGKETAKETDAAVNAILGAHKLVAG